MNKRTIHDYAPADYGALERLQKEAQNRADKTSLRLKKFQKSSKKLKNFYSRHRMNWVDSWERVTTAETQASLNLEDHMESLFLLNSPQKFQTPPDTLADINSEISKMDSEISEISRELETESENEVEKEKLKIPEFIWNRFLNLNLYSNNPIVAELICAVDSALESLQTEYRKLENLGKQFRKTENELRIWMTFIYNLWPQNMEKATLYGADLKKVLKNSGLLKNRSILELNSIDRIFAQLNQQQIKVRSAEIESQKIISRISTICDEILSEHFKNEENIRNKVQNLENWNKYCDETKTRLEELRNEHQIKSKLEAEYLAEKSAIELEQERLENEREKSRRDELREKVQTWKVKNDQEKTKHELFSEMVEFERRQQFQESLPILREAADRRENIRLKKLEERNLRETEREIEKEKRENILEQIRAQVRVDAPKDPTRLVKNTESWKHRILSDRQNNELFSLQSFTDKQLMSDQRLRFQILLRESNIPISTYALHTMSSLQPATVPRKDTFNSKR